MCVNTETQKECNVCDLKVKVQDPDRYNLYKEKDNDQNKQ